tara:strand:+ start:1325 stop:1783 length:459 start_codon:yes stop_codon:yes gene_type:complete
MLTFSLILSTIALIGIGSAVWMGRKSYRRYQANIAMAHELKNLAESLGDAAKTRQRIHPATLDDPDDPFALDSPAMLATLVTVLVARLGTVRLSLLDFAKIGDSDYVSVYVDRSSQEILLSLDHTLAAQDQGTEEAMGMPWASVDPDDTTFH